MTEWGSYGSEERKLKKVCGGDLQMIDETEQCRGYNQALNDCLKLIEGGE